ncbi:MAG: phosphate ABC transporter substrate-binding protein [Pseudomonadales bacterium]|nr:phosphate ABC transporter substrate-binding protein [Pseudomonadales bacterium]
MRIITLLKYSIISMLLMLLPRLSFAEIAIIVNPDSGMTKASIADVRQLFLGKRNEIDKQPARALDQMEGSSVREEFYSKVVNKTGAQLNAYWSRLIFTGKGMPPDKVDDDAEVVEAVADEEDLVGYVTLSAVDESVRVILVIP